MQVAFLQSSTKSTHVEPFQRTSFIINKYSSVRFLELLLHSGRTVWVYTIKLLTIDSIGIFRDI